MAVFGAPAANPNHAQAAVRAALEIQDEMAELNRQKKMTGMKIGVGVGLIPARCSAETWVLRREWNTRSSGQCEHRLQADQGCQSRRGLNQQENL